MSTSHLLSRGQGSHFAYARDGDLVVEWYDFGETAPYESANLIVFEPFAQRRLAEAMDAPWPLRPERLAARLARRFRTLWDVRRFAEVERIPFSRETDFWP